MIRTMKFVVMNEVNSMTENELFGNSEQLESSHFADPGKMVGDSVSRQAALDAIKKLEKPAPTAQHLSAIFDCEDIIVALPSAQRWISCSERLPEPGVYVLVDGADIPGGYRFPLIDKICDDGEWLNCDGSEWSAVAWMSIPEPWKGERDG